MAKKYHISEDVLNPESEGLAQQRKKKLLNKKSYRGQTHLKMTTRAKVTSGALEIDFQKSYFPALIETEWKMLPILYSIFFNNFTFMVGAHRSALYLFKSRPKHWRIDLLAMID